MVDGDVPVLSPWWCSQYNLCDVEAFNTATDPFFDQAYVLDPTGLAKAGAQLSARAFPGSPAGVAAAGYLTRAGYGSEPSGTFMQAVVDAITLALQQADGEEDPMVSLLIPDCFQVNIDAVSGGQPVTNVVGVENAGGTAAGAAAAVQTAWKIAAGPLANLSNLYALVQFKAVDIGDPNGDIVVVPDVATGGAGSASLATNAACALVKWNGGTRSRSSRGRLYFGPIAETNINADGRTLATGSRTAFNTAFTNFRNSLTASGYPLVVLSRILSEAFPVTSSDVEQVIATQRRRIRA